MSIFKESFRSFVKKQLAIREKIISKGNNNDSRFERDSVKLHDNTTVSLPGGAFFTNTVQRQCGIRMSSGCDITEEGADEFAEGGAYEQKKHIKGSGLARRYILQGGTLAVDRETLSHSDVTKVEQEEVKNDDNSTTSTETRTRTRKEKYKYKLGNRSGFRGISQNDFGTAYGDPTIRANPGEDYGSVPMPGIISANIRTKSAYGSLREAKVEFICHNQRQLEALELLYMRPGMPILLEWGWTPFIDNKGKMRNDFPFIGEWWISEASMDVINRKIIDAKVATGGNYDALAGMCKNFSYKARPDGGFDCTTEIIAQGEIIENLKGIELTTKSALKNLNAGELINEPDIAIDVLEVGLHDFDHFSRTAGGDIFYRTVNMLGLEQLDFEGIGQNASKAFGQLFAPSPVSTIGEYFGINKMSQKELQVALGLSDAAIQVLLNAGGSSDTESFLRLNLSQKFVPPMTKKDARGNDSLRAFGDKSEKTKRLRVNASYVRWDAFCTFLNLHVINKTAKGDPIVTFSTTMVVDEDTNNPRVEPLLMSREDGVFLTNSTSQRGGEGIGVESGRYYPYNVLLGSSVDPTICLYPEQVNVFYSDSSSSSSTTFSNTLYLGAIALGFGVAGVAGAAVVAGVGALLDAEFYNEAARKIDMTGNNKNIRNIGHIYINVARMLAIYKEQRYNGEGELNTDFNLYDFIKKLWDDISEASGGQHKFMIHNDTERPNVLRIIDANFQKDEELSPNNIHELKIQSNDSICRDFSYNSVIPNALSATIGVAIQNPNSVQDIDGATFAALAKGIKSRFHVPVESSPKTPTDKEKQQKAEDFDKLVEEIHGHFYELAEFQDEVADGKNQLTNDDGATRTAEDGEVEEKLSKAKQNLSAAARKIRKFN